MYVDALTALAHDPAVGLVAFDAFPPRLSGETPWADPVLTKAIELQRSTGVAFVSLCMSPLAYSDEAKAFTKNVEAAAVPAGTSGSVRRDPGAARSPAGAATARCRRSSRTRVAAPPGGCCAACPGRWTKRPAQRCWSSTACAGRRKPSSRRPQRAAAAARSIRGPVAVKALAPEIPHKARLGGVRLDLRGTGEVEAAAAEVLQAARRAGARAPRVLVQEMVHGHEVLVGALVDEQFGATVTIRPGGALAEAGEATFVAAPLTAKQARAFVTSQAERCGLHEDEHDLRAVAKAVEAIARAAHDLRDRVTSLEANPLLVGPRGAVAVDALAEAKPPA